MQVLYELLTKGIVTIQVNGIVTINFGSLNGLKESQVHPPSHFELGEAWKSRNTSRNVILLDPDMKRRTASSLCAQIGWVDLLKL